MNPSPNKHLHSKIVRCGLCFWSCLEHRHRCHRGHCRWSCHGGCHNCRAGPQLEEVWNNMEQLCCSWKCACVHVCIFSRVFIKECLDSSILMHFIEMLFITSSELGLFVWIEPYSCIHLKCDPRDVFDLGLNIGGSGLVSNLNASIGDGSTKTATPRKTYLC